MGARVAIWTDTASLMTDPIRAMARLAAWPKASSRPENHAAIMADCATDRDSPPNPNTARPTHITYHGAAVSGGSVSPSAKMPWPTVMRPMKTTAMSRTPSLSDRYPPRNGRMMLGQE
jgi:hypothetical protein